MLAISDRDVSLGAAGLVAAGGTITAYPLASPLFIKNGNAFYAFGPGKVSVSTAPDGSWSLELPWPSEQDPTTTQWVIQLPDGSKWSGAVPEGVSGPLTVHDLKQSYGWGVVSGSVSTPVTTLTGPIGPTGPAGPTGPVGPQGAQGNGNMTLRRDGATLHFYVDGVNGSDLNDGTQATQGAGTVGPIKTLGKIYDLAPWIMFGGINPAGLIIVDFVGDGINQVTYQLPVMYIAGGGTTWSPSMVFRGPDMIRATPATGPSTAALDAVTPATVIQLPNAKGVSVNARGRLNFTTANPGWTAGDFAGRYFLRVKRAGGRRYYELPISDNTANTITVDDPAIVADILATDTVEIVKPAVLIRGVNAGSGWESLQIYSFTSRNSWADIGTYQGATFQRIAFYNRVFCDGPGLTSFDRCSFTGDYPTTNTYVQFCNGMPMQNCALLHYGIYVFGSELSPHIPQHSRSDSSPDGVQNTSIAVQITGNGAYIVVGGFPGNDTSAQGPGTLWIVGRIGLWSSDDTGFALINVTGPGSMLQMARSYSAFIMGTSTTLFVNGLKAAKGAHVFLDPDNYCLTGHSPSADIMVGGAQATFLGTGVGCVMEAAGFNGDVTNRLHVNANGKPDGDDAWVSFNYY